MMRGIKFTPRFKKPKVRRVKKIREYRSRGPLKSTLKLIKHKPNKGWKDGGDVILDARALAAKNRREEAAALGRVRGKGPSITGTQVGAGRSAGAATSVTTATATSTSRG